MYSIMSNRKTGLFQVINFKLVIARRGRSRKLNLKMPHAQSSFTIKEDHFLVNNERLRVEHIMEILHTFAGLENFQNKTER